jgi:hypothetical protein
MVPVADTRLHAIDAPGSTPALLFLSGGFGTVQNWSRVVRRLDGKYRTVRFDARARGKSGRSADYSVQAAVDDIERVIDETGIERPILVGWSHGAPVAVRYVVIEMDAVNGELGPDFAALECPTVFVVGTGAHSGATEDEMRTVRAAVADAVESNERVSVFATTPHKHTQILSKAPDTVVAAIEDVIHRVA